MKKLLLALVFLFVLLIGAAIAIPYFFKDEIVAAVKEAANENLDANLDFDDVSISLFRDFPNVSFGMQDLRITGKGDFDKVNLISAKNFDIALDFWSAWNGGDPLVINGITIDEPNLNVHVLQNGNANYNITKGEEESTESAAYVINLDEYEINNGTLTYKDQSMDFFMKMEGLDHTGSGNLTADVYDLTTETTAKKMTTSMGGITYLNGVKADLDALINMDLKNMKFTLKDNDLKLNALKLLAEGWVQLGETDMDMDLKFKAPANSFKEFLSMVPGAYSSSFDGVKADGKFGFDAFVKGKYNGDKDIMPAFRLKMDVENGNFKFPDLPTPVSNIFAKIDINSPSSNMNKMVVKIPKFSMKAGNNPFEGYFNLRTPLTDPNIDTKVKGKIDLAQISKAMPLEGVESLSGLIDADMELKGKMSQMESGNYSGVDAKGYFNIVNMEYRAVDMPKVEIKKMSTNLSPKRMEVKDFDMKLGKSDLKGNGEIDNVLAYFSDEKTMTGDFFVRSSLLDANEWISEEEGSAPSGETEEAPFDRFDFKLDGQADIIKYEDYKLLNTVAKGRMTSNDLDMKQFSTKVGKSDIKATGKIQNIFDYLFENGTLRGDITLSGNKLDLNELMGEEAEATTEEPLSEPIMVPENISMDIKADIDQVLYDNMDLKNVRGKVEVKNERVSMKQVSTNSLGGKMYFSGTYNSKDVEEPKFDMTYDLKKIDFKQAFETFNSFQQLAPIAQFISGSFSSDMEMNGALGKDLMPKLEKLNADGFLETLNGFITGFEPLDEVANLLNVKELKKGNLKELKTVFKLNDGMVTVEEFPFKFQGIDMTMGGMHGLTQNMDYKIKARIPRSLLEKSGITSSANKGLKLLTKQASKSGINIDVGEFINVMINVTGTMKDPKTSLKLLGTDGEKLDIVKEVQAQVEEKVEEKVEEVKTEVKEKVDTKKEDLKKKADAEVAAIKAKAESQANRLRKQGDAAAKKAKDFGYAGADRLIKEAGNNPLKKAGAKLAADRLRRETDKKVEKIQAEWNAKVDAVLKKADDQAEGVRRKYEKM